METQTGHVMNLANSIIGVSILAMPYCFQECGIILSIILLILTNILSRLTCHFLLKSALMARRKTFEYLAFYIFGSFGKFFIEIGIIGFLLGTCIAFFVVMGDLGPQIIAEITGTETTDTMRSSILMALALFCVLPLGLLRNVDSLNGVSKATIGFYFCLILKIIIVALPHIFDGDWLPRVSLWKMDGILQCLPIFAMALSCQTQLFEIYQVLPNASLEKMNRIVATAVNICTCVYICVGLFGYIAFSSRPFTGNILSSFNVSLSNSAIKIGFIFSLAFSFPLVIFPCRASLYSLLYRGNYSVHDGVSNYIPEAKFKSLTFIIVFTSLLIGIMIPNIEVVLGLVGSTIGVMICVLFPVTSFICISQKNTNERLTAQALLFLGVIIMVLSTYANLFAIEKVAVSPITPVSNYNQQQVRNKVNDALEVPSVDSVKKDTVIETPVIGNDRGPDISKKRLKKKKIKNDTDLKDTKLVEEAKVEIMEPQQPEVVKEIRHEPPQPVEPVEIQEVANPVLPVTDLPKVGEERKPEKTDEKNDEHQSDLLKISETKDDEKKNKVKPDKIDKGKERDYGDSIIENVDKIEKKIDDNIQKIQELAKDNNQILEGKHEADKKPETGGVPDEKQNLNQDNFKAGETGLKINPAEGSDKKNEKKTDEVDIEAIIKEEKELKEQEKQQKQENEIAKEDKEKVLIERLQKQNEVQKELVEQQRKIIMEVLKNQDKHKSAEIDKEKLEAVRRIESVAKKAIESISGNEVGAQKAIDEKTLEEPSKQVTEKEKVQESDSIVSSKPIVNAAPLSYQLRLNNQLNLSDNMNYSDVKTKEMLLPFPLMVSSNLKNKANNLSQNNAVNEVVNVEHQQEEAIKIREEKTDDVQNEQVKDNENVNENQENLNVIEKINKPDQTEEKHENNNDVNAIRREILSEKLNRTKRDINSDKNVYNSLTLTSKQINKETMNLAVKVAEDETCPDEKNEVYEEISNTSKRPSNKSKSDLNTQDELATKSKTVLETKNSGKEKSENREIKTKPENNLKLTQLLSDHKLLSPDLKLLNVENFIQVKPHLDDIIDAPIKPQTRDLKQIEKDEN